MGYGALKNHVEKGACVYGLWCTEESCGEGSLCLGYGALKRHVEKVPELIA